MQTSPLQNRVTPEGEIIATPERGTMMGNRGGRFHGADQRLMPRRRWASRQWICCRLEFKGRKRQVMQPRRYTELFFLDEATALAAGHRPCFECRRTDAVSFQRFWAAAKGLDAPPAAPEMDRVLHRERVNADGSKRLHRSTAPLPPGTFIVHAGVPALVTACAHEGPMVLAPWSPAGYGVQRMIMRPDDVEVLTPPSIVAVLRAGYRPALHDTAPSCVAPSLRPATRRPANVRPPV